jgi:hypothetical protein
VVRGGTRPSGLRRDPGLSLPVEEKGPARSQVEQAKCLCFECPVRGFCLDWAVQTGDKEVRTPERPDDELHIQHWLSVNCFGDHLTRSGLDLPTGAVPGRPLAGPDRPRTHTMDRPLETSAERVRRHLRRPQAGSRNLLMNTARDTVAVTDPSIWRTRLGRRTGQFCVIVRRVFPGRRVCVRWLGLSVSRIEVMLWSC